LHCRFIDRNKTAILADEVNQVHVYVYVLPPPPPSRSSSYCCIFDVRGFNILLAEPCGL
jgi:hypothetical protein